VSSTKFFTPQAAFAGGSPAFLKLIEVYDKAHPKA
jgi:hypothetical protein